jgi:hypothetical protein
MFNQWVESTEALSVWVERFLKQGLTDDWQVGIFVLHSLFV